jgi:hypothetical protein
MPTNPLWLEHTERAAWGTVEALRGEIERAQRRLARLTELQPAWPRLLEAFDRIKLEHGIERDDPEQIVQELRRIAGEAVRERDELKRELSHVQGARREALAVAAPPADPRAVELRPAVRWFAKLLDRRNRRVRARPSSSTDVRRLIEALDLKVEELAQARSHELIEAAVEVGNIALAIARWAKSEKSKPRP